MDQNKQRSRGGRRKQKHITTVIGHRPSIHHPHPRQSPTSTHTDHGPRPPSTLTPINCDNTKYTTIKDNGKSTGTSCVNVKKFNGKKLRPNLRKIDILSLISTHNTNVASLKCGLLNARSVNKKEALIIDCILEHNFDIFVITETWLKEDNRSILPDGFDCIFRHRQNGKGGGIAVVFRDDIKLQVNDSQSNYITFENIEMTLTSNNNIHHRLIAIYRPPPSLQNKFTHNQFLNEFDTFALDISTISQEMTMLGDFNVHIDDNSNSNSIKFKNIISSHNLQQFVAGETHVSGHTLDLIIARKDQTIVDGVSVLECAISDHSLISSTATNRLYG